MAKKQLILNAFVESCSGHQSPGLWAHPDDESSNFNDVKYWVRLAKLLEAANFHGIFIADVLVSLPLHFVHVTKQLKLVCREPTTSTRGPRMPIPPLSRAPSGQ